MRLGRTITRSRSCEGPEASSGPIELVAGQMQPAVFAQVGERIYWADAWDEWLGEDPSTTLFRTKAGAGEAWIAVAADQPGINDIVATTEHVYWVVEGASQPGGKLLRANLDDEVEVLDEGLLSPRALTLGDGNDWVYYVEGGRLAEHDAKVLRIRPDGSGKQVLAESVGQIEDLAVDDSHVWWVTPITGEIWRVDKEGGEAELLGDVPHPAQIEVQHGVAWTLGLTGLYRVEVGEEPYFIINGFSGPYELAADSSHVYLTRWNGFGDDHLGWIHRYPLKDGEYKLFDGEFVVPKAAPKPTAVRVDEHAVYWSTADEDSGQGEIWMLCKSAI